jgi:hypothetical protein
VQDNRLQLGIDKHASWANPGWLHAQSSSFRSRITQSPTSPLSIIEDNREDFSPPPHELAALNASSLRTNEQKGGPQMTPAGWARTHDEKTCAHLVHIISIGSFAAVGTSGERLGINLGLKGCTGSVRQELQRPEPGFPITYERTQVGLAPIVSGESCPSMGRSKKRGGSVPPETNGHL